MAALSLLLAAVLASAPAEGTASPDAIWIDVPHGSFPRLTKHKVEGKLPRSGHRVAASVSVQEQGWQATVEGEGWTTVRLRVGSEGRGNPQLDRVLLWASNDQQELRLKMPYGMPQEKCFANGDEVFASISLVISRTGQPQVYETRFQDCEVRRKELVPAQENGWLIITN